MSDKKIVIITEKECVGTDEVYCDWFRCPKCGKDDIANFCNYCPTCGVKIEFKKG